MTAALIGHTGFVGSNLDRATHFDVRFNSRNYSDMRGGSYGLVVCAGIYAAKWLANKEPEQDWDRIAELMAVLKTVEADEFVLISTIDVYPYPKSGGDESEAIDPSRNHPYGRHRFEFEQWVQTRFPRARIVRLPALYGPGLKKNVLFDLLHDNQLDNINPDGVCQWYPVDRLWADLEIVRRHDLRLVNLFPEPLPMRSILDALFPYVVVGPARIPASEYRLRTRHAPLFDGRDGYLMTAEQGMAGLRAFVADARAQGSENGTG